MLGFLRSASAVPVAAELPAGGSVACFGKLPIQPDFIKCGLNSRELLSLDRWVQEGFAQMALSDNRDWTLPPVAHHFVFPGSDDDRSVLATIGPSHDSSGRQYPFGVAFRLSEADTHLDPAPLAIAARPFFEGTLSLLRHPWRGERPAALAPRLQSLAASAAVGDAGSRSRVGLACLRDTSAEVIRQAADQAGCAAGRLLSTVADCCRQVGLRTPQRTAWGLRLPLSGGAQDYALVTFWLQLVRALVGQSWRGAWVWTAPDQRRLAASLTVYFRAPSPYCLRHLQEAPPRDGTLQDAASLARSQVDNDAGFHQLQAEGLDQILFRHTSAGRRP